MSELGTEMNRTESYNPVTQEWCQLSAMLTSRAYIALAALDGCLYAVGGWNEDGGALSTVEKYSIEEVRSCARLVSLMRIASILTLHFCSRLYAGSHFCQARIVLVDA